MSEDEALDGNFILVVADYVPYINPADYGLTDQSVPNINPADYFITSGDAVAKALTLEKDLWAAAGSAKRLLSKSKDKAHGRFVSALWSAAGKCRSLVNKLKRVRGTALWLETAWEDHNLICVPKNPRPKKVEI